MFNILILLFTVLPVLELVVLIKTGAIIGAWNTIFLNIVIGVVGASIARYEGLSILARTQESLSRGVMPSNELMDGFIIFAAGILLLTPGFITDSVGILLLFPLTRSVIKYFMKKKLKRMFEQGQVISFSNFANKGDNGHYNDIDV